MLFLLNVVGVICFQGGQFQPLEDNEEMTNLIEQEVWVY